MLTNILSPFRIVLLFLLIAIAGLLCLRYQKISLLPTGTFKQMDIYFSLPDSPPEVIENKITAVLENALSQIEGIKKITSSSAYNNGHISLEFDKNANMDQCRFEVSALVRRIYPQLPPGAGYPYISSNAGNITNNQPFLIYTVQGPQQPFEIKNVTEALFKNRLAGIKGIQQINISGNNNLQVNIVYDKDKCMAWKISTASVQEALQQQAQTTYPGSFITKKGEQLFLIIKPIVANSTDSIKDVLATIENLIIPNGNKGIPLKTVAAVYMQEAPADNFFRINGKSAVTLYITAKKEENIIEVSKQARELITKIKQGLPAGYGISLIQDDTDFLQLEIQKNIKRTILSITILSLFILISYRNWRHLFVLIGSLICTLCITFLFTFIGNIPIHLYSIAGLAISFGIITDNAIVMLDHYRHYKNKKIFLPLLSASCTTISAMALIFFLPDADKTNLTGFALVIMVALLASLMSVLWLVPGLYQLVHPANHKKFSQKLQSKKMRSLVKFKNRYFFFIFFIARWRRVFVALLLLLFGLPIFLLPTKWEGNKWYNKIYNSSIGSEKYTETLRPFIDKWTGGTLRLFINNISENSGYRDPQQTKLYVNAELPPGNTISQMNTIIEGVEKYLSTVNGINQYTTQVSDGQHATIEISFTAKEQNGALPYQLKNRLITKVLDWGGVAWNVYGIGQGFSNTANNEMPSYQINLKGYNYAELERQAKVLAQNLLQNKRIQKVNINERHGYEEKEVTEIGLQIDLRKAALHNTSPNQLLNSYNNLVNTVYSFPLYIDNKSYPVAIREKMADEFTTRQLLYQVVTIDSTKKIRLGEIATIDKQTAASVIIKENRQYLRIVSFDYLGGWEFGQEYVVKILKNANATMPIGYTASQNGYMVDDKKQRQYLLLLLLALTIFFICTVLFESLRKPFYIISIIPLCFIGLFLAFYWGDFYFDQGGFAAFVLLGGLVVNGAIFLTYSFEALKKSSLIQPANNLLIKAAISRSRTILLTTLSSCCGMVPFLIEGQNEIFWFALAAGTIGGLLISILAIFIVLPVFLWKFEKSKKITKGQL